MKSLTRRDFLYTSTALMGATMMPNQAVSDSHQHAVSCRDAHLNVVEAPTVWEAAKKIGLQGMEVWVDDQRVCTNLFGTDTIRLNNRDDLQRLKDLTEEHGIQVSAFAMPNRFDERLDFEIQWIIDVIKACQVLEVDAIRIDVVPRKINQEEEFLKFAIEAGKKIVSLVDGTNIRYGIENHGSTTNKPEFLEPLFDGVDSEKLGLTLDTANFYWFGHPLERLYEIFETFAPRAYHTHCKSIDYPPEKENVQRERGWKYGQYASPIYEGDIDFNKVFTLLKNAGYQGDLCIENESLGRFDENQRESVLQKEVDFLKNLS